MSAAFERWRAWLDQADWSQRGRAIEVAAEVVSYFGGATSATAEEVQALCHFVVDLSSALSAEASMQPDPQPLRSEAVAILMLTASLGKARNVDPVGRASVDNMISLFHHEDGRFELALQYLDGVVSTLRKHSPLDLVGLWLPPVLHERAEVLQALGRTVEAATDRVESRRLQREHLELIGQCELADKLLGSVGE